MFAFLTVRIAAQLISAGEQCPPLCLLLPHPLDYGAAAVWAFPQSRNEESVCRFAMCRTRRGSCRRVSARCRWVEPISDEKGRVLDFSVSGPPRETRRLQHRD